MITPFPPDGIGGAETFIRDLIKESSKHHEVDICTMKKRKKSWKGTGAINFFSTFPAMFTKSLIMLFIKKYEILHAQGLISGLVAVLLKKVFKVKVFITLLALYEFKNWTGIRLKMSKWLFNNCDVIFVEGENGKEDIRIFGTGEKIRAFNHWVNQDIFKPNITLRDTGEPKIKILFVGRPIPEKGRHIIEEVERIINQPEKYHFTYVENVPYDLLSSYYQMAHILIVPSLYSEGYVRVVAEGASCGCAVITSNRGSLPEMVKDFGIVFNGIPTSLSRVMSMNTNHISEWQEKAYRYAKENFSSKNAEVFLNEYSNV